MNRLLLLLAILICSKSYSQSLRDSLFSGKLKADSALVAKSKINEQKAKEDSIRRAQGETAKTDATGNIIPPADSTQKANTPEVPLKYSDNTRVWKKFTDEYVKVVTTEMQANKKIKRGDYTVTLEYEIGTDGVVSTKNIICDPKSEGVIDLINERMMSNAPKLAPQIVNGAPRKSSRRQILIFSKDKN